MAATMAADLKFRAFKTTRRIIPEQPQRLACVENNCNLLIPKVPSIVWYGIIAGFALLSYINSLNCELVHDDIFAIKDNKDVYSNTSMYDVFRNDFWGKPMSSNTSHKSYRPLCVLTFRVNFLIHGLNPFGYHVVNVILHVVASCGFVYFAEFVVFKSMRLAAVAGLLFATHPVHTEAVAGVVGRADVFACVLFLLSLILFIRSISTSTGVSQWLNLLGCLVVGGMAMLVKEQGISVFGVCVVYDVFIANKVWNRVWKKGWSHLFPIPKSLVNRLVILTIMTLSLLIFRIWMLDGSLPHFIKQDNPASFVDSLPTRVMTYCFLYAFNSWLLLSPSTLCYDWQGGSIPLVETIWDLRNLATIAFFIVIGLLVYHSLFTTKEEDQVIVLTGLTLLVVPFLPATNIFLRVGFVVAERILYIPSMGFCLLVTHGANKLARPTLLNTKNKQTDLDHRPTRDHSMFMKSWTSNMVTVGLSVLIIAFCVKTVKRNEVWRTRETLFKSGVDTLPHNAKAHYNYGNFLKDIGKHEEATQHYRTSIHLEPDHVSSHNNLGTLLDNDIEEAIKHFEIAVKYDPMHASSYFNLGVRYGYQKKFQMAEKMLNEALRIKPGYLDAMLNLAGILSEQNKLDEAETVYRKVLTVSPHNADGYNNYGVFLVKIGKPNDALSAYKHAIHLQSDHSVAYVNMGRLLKSLGEIQKAEQAFKKALSIKRDLATLQLLGVLYFNENRHSDAEAAWQEALKMNPEHEETLANMGILMSHTGHLKDAVQLATKVLHLNPNKPDHYKNLASVLQQSGETTEAIKTLSAALVKFQTADLHYHHGNLLKDINRYDDAKQSYINAVKIDPRHSSAHMNLGVILHIQKDYTKARQHYEAALSLDPHNPVLQQNLAKLKRLQAKRQA